MSYLYKAIAIFLLSAAVSIPGFAEDKPMGMQHGKTSGEEAKKSMKMGMEMSEEMKDKHARGMQKYILQQNDLSDRIQAEKNPEKKQALMDEQLQLIKDHMEKKRAMKKMMMKKHHEKMMENKSMNM
jgi:hypothetical protein